MPDPVTFVFVGVLAGGAAMMSMRSDLDAGTRALAAATSMMVWAIWAFQAKNILLTPGGSADVVTKQFDGLFYLGLGLALVMLMATGQMALLTLVGEDGSFEDLI